MKTVFYYNFPSLLYINIEYSPVITRNNLCVDFVEKNIKNYLDFIQIDVLFFLKK